MTAAVGLIDGPSHEAALLQLVDPADQMALARAGHRVFASMRNTRTTNAKAARELRGLATAERLPLEIVDIDIRDDRSVESGVARVRQRAGRIDVLVNNAGIFYPAILETLTIADLRDVFETNVFGHLRMNRAVLPAMREQGEGLVVQITTALGRFVFPFMGAYVGSKWAMEALTEVSRSELRRSGIDFVIVEPGARARGLPAQRHGGLRIRRSALKL